MFSTYTGKLYFARDFSELLVSVMPRIDRVLILGDFNIHICYPSGSSFIKDFMDLVKSSNLTWSAESLTHPEGHAPDIVSSCGFSLDSIDLCENQGMCV